LVIIKKRKMELVALSIIGGVAFFSVLVVVIAHKKGTLK
jgi:hypothetical protein